MRIVWMLVVFLALASLIGCFAFTPEQEENRNRLIKSIEELHEEMSDAATQIERIYAMQDDVRAQVKAGELTTEAAFALLAELDKEAREAVEHYAVLKEKGADLVADLKTLSESGVPWYQTAWSIVATLLAIYAGKKSLNFKNALVDMISGIENMGNFRSMKNAKKAIAGLENDLIDKVVKKNTS